MIFVSAGFSRVFYIAGRTSRDFCFRRFFLAILYRRENFPRFLFPMGFSRVFCIAGRTFRFALPGKMAPLCKGRYNVTFGQLDGLFTT